MQFKTQSKFRNTFKMRVKHADGTIKWYEFPNGLTTLGKNALLNIMFRSTSKETAWYIGLIDDAGFSALDASDTLASHAGWVELTDYTGDRKLWDPDAAAAGVVTNSVAAEFDIDDTVSVKGIFVCSAETGTSGVLWATAAFPAGSIPLGSGSQITIIYSVSVTEA